jgi:hypothetical protein
VRSQNDLNPRICSLFSLSNGNSFVALFVFVAPAPGRLEWRLPAAISALPEASPFEPGL